MLEPLTISCHGADMLDSMKTNSVEGAAEPVASVPGVSVILPILNEEKDLELAVNRILAQEYSGPFEVVLAVGPSNDRTMEIAEELSERDSRITVVENPTGATPAGLNIAIKAARHDILVRVDGHSIIPDGYVAEAVSVMLETRAANVGGMMMPQGTNPFSEAVARAMSSPLGIGSAPFHTGGQAGPADTVYLGVFQRKALERIGGFDERFARAQDWELNYRLRKAGEKVWFDPSLQVGYHPRRNLKALAKQFFRTGRWRRHVIRAYPETAGLRYLAPPAAVIGLTIGTAAGIVGAFSTGVLQWLNFGWLAPFGYTVLVIGGSAATNSGLSTAAKLRLPLVIATMHTSWGVGFLLPARNDRP